MARLGDVCTINPRIKTFQDDFMVSFVPMQNVSEEGTVDASIIKYYGEVKKGFTYFQENDVLFAKITPCMENGKGGIARNLKNGVAFGSTEFHVLRPNPNFMISSWLYYLTSWPEFRKECEKNMTGSAGQKRVPKTFLENYEIQLPELDEQRKIAAVLDKVSDLIAKRRKQLDKLDELIKARFVEMFGKRFPECTLLSLCNIIDYRGKTPQKVDFGLPFITAKNIRMHRMVLEPKEYISKETYDKVMVRGFPKEGDVVFTTEAPLGNVCRIPHFDTEFYVGQRIVTLQTTALHPAYLEYALDTEEFKKKIAEKSSGSTVAGIRVRLLEQLTIPVPPLDLQNQFAAFVEQTEKTKTTISRSLEKLETLKKALMQEYFG